jgi:hypothetical protein
VTENYHEIGTNDTGTSKVECGNTQYGVARPVSAGKGLTRVAAVRRLINLRSER